jgi:hypothetical protein
VRTAVGGLQRLSSRLPRLMSSGTGPPKAFSWDDCLAGYFSARSQGARATGTAGAKNPIGPCGLVCKAHAAISHFGWVLGRCLAVLTVLLWRRPATIYFSSINARPPP